MHDLSFFRNNLDAVAERLATRGLTLDVSQFRDLDVRRRAALTETETLRAQRNAESQKIAALRKAGEDTSQQQSEVRAIRTKSSRP